MLLKILTGDHLHTPLLDVETGLPRFTTVSHYMHPCNSFASESTNSSGSSSSPTRWKYPVDRFADGSSIPVQGRHTWILDADENVLAEIVFGNESPVAIKVAGRTPIIGRYCSTRFFTHMDDQTDVLVMQTRVDDFEWVVTKSGMTLIDSDHEIAMNYHPNARLDRAGRVRRRPRLLHGGAFLEIRAGVNYLESEELAELLVTFCLMEIVRRRRFKLTPYLHTDDGRISTLVRYRAIIGAAGSKLRELLGRRAHDIPGTS